MLYDFEVLKKSQHLETKIDLSVHSLPAVWIRMRESGKDLQSSTNFTRYLGTSSARAEPQIVVVYTKKAAATWDRISQEVASAKKSQPCVRDL